MEALIGLVGVVIGSAITQFSTWYLHRKGNETKVRFLAIRAIVALEAFATDCAFKLTNTVRDVESEGQVYFEQPDDIHLPDDGDWSYIDPDVAFEILELPHRVQAARQGIEFIIDVTGDTYEGRKLRNKEFSKIALSAFQAAAKLRNQLSLEARNDEDWSLESDLREISEKSEPLQKTAT